ncbi:MAG TPA: hypothetical protein VET24_10230 [Actinomycetota bacterium]|nr:hypothetical protein [Actinomycetota bacterium]
MQSYFVSPPAETDWHIDPEDFAARLRARWPDAEVRRVSNPMRTDTLDFVLHDVGGERVDGHLDEHSRAVVLEGSPRAAAEVAAWFRTQVPPSQPLIFFDEGYTASVDLTQGLDPSELVAPFV